MGRHARRRFPWALVSALAVVALIAGLAFAMANRKSDPAKANKTTTATGTRSTTSSGEATQECADLRLAVAPQIAPLVADLVRADGAVCGKVTV